MTRSSLAFMFSISLVMSCFFQTSHTYAKNSSSNLPVPRYVSFRSDKVNLRQGPGKDYVIKWVFKRIGLPVEVIAEYEHWRKVRDSQGTEGWVFHRMLTGRRTALVTPWEKKKKPLNLYSKASSKSAIAAQFEPGVLVNIDACDGQWCSLEVSGMNGWVKQSLLWGVYANEKIK